MPQTFLPDAESGSWTTPRGGSSGWWFNWGSGVHKGWGTCVIFLGICLATPPFKQPLPHLDSSSFIMASCLCHLLNSCIYFCLFLDFSLSHPVYSCAIWTIWALDDTHCLITVASYTLYASSFAIFSLLFVISFLMRFRLTLSVSPNC